MIVIKLHGSNYNSLKAEHFIIFRNEAKVLKGPIRDRVLRFGFCSRLPRFSINFEFIPIPGYRVNYITI